MKLTRLDYVTIALAVTVPALAYFGYFQGRLAQFRDIKQTRGELVEKTAGHSRTGGDLAIVRKNTRLIEQRLTDFIGSMTGQNEAHMAVNAVVQNAKEAGVDIQLIRPGTPLKGKTLNCLPIDVTASAAFPQLYDFLGRIEHGRTVITVSRMELESNPLSETCTVTFQLRVYFVNVKPGDAAGREVAARTEFNEKSPAPTKMAVCKSKKELVILCVAAVVVVVVLYSMYFKGGDDEAEMTGPAAVAVDVPRTIEVVEAPVDVVITNLPITDASAAPETAEAVPLTRDPFAMSGFIRERVYGVAEVETADEGPARPVTLTQKNQRSVLSQIPGAEQAAAKGFHIEAILLTGDWSGAMINGRVVRVGESLLGFTLTDVSDADVILEREGHRVRLLVHPPKEGDGDATQPTWRPQQ